jgi:hypothetical protein
LLYRAGCLFVHVGIRSATRVADHNLEVKLKCPKANMIKCVGTLSVRAHSRHYSVGAGKSATVGLGRVGGRKVNLTATEPGSFGPETVTRLLRVR